MGEDGLRRLDAEFLSFYAALAAGLYDGLRKAEQNTVVAVDVEEANLLRALRLAQVGQRWGPAQDIVQTLSELYELRGRADEWRRPRS